LNLLRFAKPIDREFSITAVNGAAFIGHSLGSVLIAPLILPFAQLFIAARRNVPPLATPVFLGGFCGSLFCFRN
jgi:hypothetical protein